WRAVGGRDGALPYQRCALLAAAHRNGAAGAAVRSMRHVVRTFDRSLVAFAVIGGHLLDGMLDPNVEEQWPFAVGSHVDQPGFECVVLVIGDAVTADGVVHR